MPIAATRSNSHIASRQRLERARLCPAYEYDMVHWMGRAIAAVGGHRDERLNVGSRQDTMSPVLLFREGSSGTTPQSIDTLFELLSADCDSRIDVHAVAHRR